MADFWEEGRGQGTSIYLVDLPCRSDHHGQVPRHHSRLCVRWCTSVQCQHRGSWALWRPRLQCQGTARRNRGVLDALRQVSYLHGTLPTVEVFKLLCHIWIWIDLLKCVVCLQTEELSEFVQRTAIPGTRLPHTKNGDSSQAFWDVPSTESTWRTCGQSLTWG